MDLEGKHRNPLTWKNWAVLETWMTVVSCCQTWNVLMDLANTVKYKKKKIFTQNTGQSKIHLNIFYLMCYINIVVLWLGCARKNLYAECLQIVPTFTLCSRIVRKSRRRTVYIIVNINLGNYSFLKIEIFIDFPIQKKN